MLYNLFLLLYYFDLISREFNTDNLTTDRLRADIAKLNANIVSSCISQGIPMDNTNVTHTLENLYKLLTFKRYLSRLVEYIL